MMLSLAGLFSADASIGALGFSDCMHDYVEEQHLKKLPIDFLLQKCAFRNTLTPEG